MVAGDLMVVAVFQGRMHLRWIVQALMQLAGLLKALSLLAYAKEY